MADTTPSPGTPATRSRRGRFASTAFLVGIVAVALLLATLGATADPTPGSTGASDESAQAEGDVAPPSEQPLEELADALGERLGTDVEPDDVEAAITAVIDERLDEAVAAGTLSRDQADALREQLHDGMTSGEFALPLPRFRLPDPDRFEAPPRGPGPFPFQEGEPTRPAPSPAAGGPYLGIEGTTVDPEVVDLFGLEIDAGAIVAGVGEETPAAAAGLQRGDVITALDGDPIDSFEALAAAVAEREPGDAITLTLVREGAEQDVDVELAARTAEDAG